MKERLLMKENYVEGCKRPGAACGARATPPIGDSLSVQNLSVHASLLVQMYR